MRCDAIIRETIQITIIIQNGRNHHRSLKNHLEAFLTVLKIPFSSACQDTSLSSAPRFMRSRETHLTLLETVLLCFLIFPSDDSARSKEGLNGSLPDPARPELIDDVLSDKAIEMEVVRDLYVVVPFLSPSPFLGIGLGRVA
jgi:hypothetical protein